VLPGVPTVKLVPYLGKYRHSICTQLFLHVSSHYLGILLHILYTSISIMAPPLTADATTMIEWCLKEPRPTHFFTGRLGLPHSDHNKKDKGRPSFEGSAAHSCKDLYQSTLMSVNLLTHRFLTKEALRVATVQNRDELIAQVTEPLLADYGSAIWCTSEPYTTRIGPEYPQYLKHDNNMDRER
jgi:hypothetical protein